ncbi:MAG: Spy/CpxP family protein refolding chaperone [Candidatus Kapaibacterium sp.]
MKMKITRPVVALLASMTLMAGSAYAQEDGSIMDRLNLSAQQKTQIKTLREQFQSETKPLRDDIKKLLETERQLKSATPLNEASLRPVLKQRADKEIELSLALTRFNENLEGILTADQKNLLKQIRGQRNHK